MRRLLKVASVVVAATVASGIAFEALAATGDSRRYLAPGRIVETGGRRVRLDCTGSGQPTVVLEAGLGESGLTWAAIQPVVAAQTRVCSYDRPGYGWSMSAHGPRDAQREAGELHSLLAAAGEVGPYLLVGHSIGAFVVRLFAATYPAEVIGIVLVDPTDEAVVVEAGVPAIATFETRFRGVVARLGVMRLVGRSLVADAVGAEPPPAVLDNVPVLYSPTAMATALAELEASADSARQVTAARLGTGISVTILSAADTPEATLSRRASLARQAPGGRHDVAPGTSHYVHYQQPALVADVILAAMEGRALTLVRAPSR